MKKKFSVYLTIAALAVLALENSAMGQVFQFSQPTPFTTTTTNSSLLASNTVAIQMPSVTLTIAVTNPVALITNTFNTTFTNSAVNFTIQRTFVYSAATYGTNFSTNWPPFSMIFGVYSYGQAAQSAGNTNGASIQ